MKRRGGGVDGLATMALASFADARQPVAARDFKSRLLRLLGSASPPEAAIASDGHGRISIDDDTWPSVVGCHALLHNVARAFKSERALDCDAAAEPRKRPPDPS